MTYYNFTFAVGAENARMIKMISDTVSQFFDDDRIHFECYYEMQDCGFVFFGLYTCCNEALYERDSKVIDAMMHYMQNFNEPYDGGDIIFDARIEEGSFEEFEAKYDENDEETLVTAPEIMEELQAAMEKYTDDDFEIADDEDSPEEEAFDLTSVLFDPNLIAKLDADEINQINEDVFNRVEPGSRILVLDEETAESGALFEMMMKSSLKAAMVRR